MPVPVRSAHWIEHAGFRRAVADYLEHERREVREGIDYLDGGGINRKVQRGRVEIQGND